MALIYHWTFEKNITEIIGSYAATTTNATFPTSVKIRGNYSVYFAGNSACAYAGTAVYLVRRPTFTISHWVKGGSQSTRNTFSTYAQNYRNWSIDSGTSSDGLNLVYYDGAVIRSASAPVLDGLWHLYTVSYTAGSVVNYVDGVYYNSDTIEEPDFGTNNITGYSMGYFQPSAPSSHFTGYMDDLRVFDTVLTAAEVKALYNSYFTEKSVSMMPFIG